MIIIGRNSRQTTTTTTTQHTTHQEQQEQAQQKRSSLRKPPRRMMMWGIGPTTGPTTTASSGGSSTGTQVMLNNSQSLLESLAFEPPRTPPPPRLSSRRGMDLIRVETRRVAPSPSVVGGSLRLPEMNSPRTLDSVEVIFFDAAEHEEETEVWLDLPQPETAKPNTKSSLSQVLFHRRGGGTKRRGSLSSRRPSASAASVASLQPQEEAFHDTHMATNEVSSPKAKAAAAAYSPPATPIQKQPPPPPPQQQYPPPPPAPPQELPLRFLRAGKNDPEEGMRRYEATLQWRKEHRIDTILFEPQPHFYLIKENYKVFYHLRGKKGEPVFYEQPAQTNLKKLREGGVGVDMLLRFYAAIQEYLWQAVEPDDMARSIYIVDMRGIGFGDFVGEVVDFVKKASQFTGAHYPERAGTVFIVNAPGYFKFIWNIVKGWIDPATLEKIFILRGKEEMMARMQERISVENIPPEYGGQSMPLGASPEEERLAEWMDHNNSMSQNNLVCPRGGSEHSCPFCTWRLARAY